MAPQQPQELSSSRLTLEEIDDGIQRMNRLKTLDPLPPAGHVKIFEMLCELFYTRFILSKKPKDLDNVIEAGKNLLEIIAADDASRAMHLDRLACVLVSRFQIRPLKDDVDEAVKHAEEAVSLLPTEDSNWPNIMNNLGFNYSARYQKTGDYDDLEKAIECAFRVVSVTSPTDEIHLSALVNIAARYQLQFRATNDPDTADDAIAISKQILEIAPSESLIQYGALANLAAIAQDKFQQTCFWRDLEEAIRLRTLAISGVPSSHESWPLLLRGAAYLYETKYKSTRDLNDLREAISSSEKASKSRPLGLEMAQDFNFCLTSLRKLAYAIDGIEQVNEAVAKANALVQDLSEVYDSQKLDTSVANRLAYGDIFSRRYEISGQPSDLFQVVSSALSVAACVNDESRYNICALLEFINPVAKLASQPADDPIVTQVRHAFSKQYKGLLQSRNFVEVVLALKKEVDIKVDIILLHHGSQVGPPSLEDIKPELTEKWNYASSMGATSYRLRVKMVNMALVSERRTAETVHENLEKLVLAISMFESLKEGDKTQER